MVQICNKGKIVLFLSKQRSYDKRLSVKEEM